MNDADPTKALILRFFRQVITDADMDAIDALLTPDFTMFSGPMAGKPMGPAGFKKVIGANHASFPDWTALPEMIVTEGDVAVTRS